MLWKYFQVLVLRKMRFRNAFKHSKALGLRNAGTFPSLVFELLLTTWLITFYRLTLVLKVSLVLCNALFLASKFCFCCWISLLFIRKSFLSVSIFLPFWARSSFCVLKAFNCSLTSSRSRFTSSSSFNLS